MAREMLTVKGKLNGRDAVFLLDTGATTEFVDTEFAKAAQLAVTASDATIRLADGEKVGSAGIAGTVQYALQMKGGGETKFNGKFEVTQLGGYDAILGMSWFREARPRFVWDEGPVQVEIMKRTRNGRKRWKKLIMEWKKVGDAAAVIVKARRSVEAAQEHIEQEVQPARSEQEQKVYERLVRQFADVFPTELPPGLPPRRPGFEHRIQLKSHVKTPYRRPYKAGPAELELLKKMLTEFLEKGFIRRSQSRYGAPVLFTPKKDGGMRMVIDYREINKVTIKNGYPLPAMEELFPIVQGARYFSKIDLHSGYYQIRIDEKDREKTAFVTRYGSYEFLVLPMGLCNSPGTFMELMNFIFEHQLDRFVIVFLDDVLVFSKTLEEHEHHMREVLQILRENRLYAKMPKCDLIRREVDFLGHRVGAEGLDQEKAKTEAIVSWTVPTTKKELQRFLGLAGYYRKFIENYAHVAAPLTKLTGTSMAFEWTTEQQTAFDELKRRLVAAPVLALPDVSKPFVIHTDASVYAVGAALQQDQGKGLQPVAFMSVTLTEPQRSWPTHEQEMFAVVEGCRYWRHLISGRSVTARSDHNSLQHFFTQRTLSPRQVRWMEELAEYDIEIEYVKGKQNVVADALSRKLSRVLPAAAPPVVRCGCGC